MTVLHTLYSLCNPAIDSSLYRQIIARGLLDVLRDFSSTEDDFLTVMEIVVRLSEDAGQYCLAALEDGNINQAWEQQGLGEGVPHL